MKVENRRTCSVCGSEFSGGLKFCPVCMLRMGLEGEVESGESSASENMVKPTPEQTVQRFEHYQLVTGEDGKPVELGRGADGRHLQSVRRGSSLSRDTESNQRAVSR